MGEPLWNLKNIHSYLKILSEKVNPLSKPLIISDWYGFVTLFSNDGIKMVMLSFLYTNDAICFNMYQIHEEPARFAIFELKW